MRIEPLYDRILLKRKTSETKTKSGIHQVTSAQEKSNYCTVVAVGEGHLNKDTGKVIPLKVEEGMTVLIGKWAGTEVKVNDVQHLVVQEEDIEAVCFDE